MKKTLIVQATPVKPKQKLRRKQALLTLFNNINKKRVKGETL